MITTDTRQEFTWTTNLKVEPKEAIDYACLVGAAYSTIIKEVALPMSSDFEACEKWLKDNIGNSIILSMIELYKELNKELETREIGLSDTYIQDWIRENANSIKLANNYRGNLDLVISELTKNEEPAEEVKEEDIPTNNNQEDIIIDVEYKEEPKSGKPSDLLDDALKRMDHIHNGVKNMNNTATEGLSFGSDNFATIPVKGILSTDPLGNHTIETMSGFIGIIASNELLKGNQISIATNDRIYLDWKAQKQNEPKNEILQGIISTIDTTKYSVTQMEPKYPGMWVMTVQTPTKNISIGIDEGTILNTDNKFIKIDDEDLDKTDIKQMRRYFVPISEKNFINNICADAYDREYLNKINIIPHAEQLDKYMRIIPMKPEVFRMMAKLIIANTSLLKEIKEAAANGDLFELSAKSTVKNISIENRDKIITLKNAKLNIQKKVA